MMKIWIQIGLFVFLFAGANAQEYYIRKGIEKKYEKKYEADRQKGEKAVNERLDAWDEKDKQNRAGIKPFQTMSMSLEMEFPDKPKNNGIIDYYFQGYECASVMNFQQKSQGIDRTIMNFKEGKSLMLMTDKKGRKTGMEMEMKSMDWAVKGAIQKSERDMANGDAEWKATDEYETIEGYKCRKYIYEDYKSRSEIFITQDIKMDFAHYNQSMYQIFASSKNGNQSVFGQAGTHGMMIRTITTSKNGSGDKSILTVKRIKMGSVPSEMFSTQGYEITKMPSIRDMWNSSKEER